VRGDGVDGGKQNVGLKNSSGVQNGPIYVIFEYWSEALIPIAMARENQHQRVEFAGLFSATAKSRPGTSLHA
jgi:hypothetical protein